MKSFLLIECEHKSFGHEVFNCSIANALSDDGQTTFLCSSEYKDSLKIQLEHEQVKVVPSFELVDPALAFADISYDWSSIFKRLKLAHRLISLAKTGKFQAYFFSFCSSQLIVSVLLAKSFSPSIRRVKTFFFIHGNAAEIGGLKPRNPFRRILGLYIWLPVARYFGLEVICLEKSVSKNISETLGLKKQLHSIPLVVPSLKNNKRGATEIQLLANVPKRLRIAMVGKITKDKGVKQFLELAKTLEGEADSIEFEFVGYPSGADTPELVARSGIPHAKAPLEWDSFLEKMSQVSVVFIWHSDHYKYAASGTVTDAIAHKKPIFGNTSDQINQIVSDVGSIGLFSATVEGLAIKVRELVKEQSTLEKQLLGFELSLAQELERRTLPYLKQALRPLLDLIPPTGEGRS
jgi:glycosyltransferase involved in cell wall biosynthesis